MYIRGLVREGEGKGGTLLIPVLEVLPACLVPDFSLLDNDNRPWPDQLDCIPSSVTDYYYF